MREYKSFDDIDQDLKRLNLERKISMEKMKLSKNKFTTNLKQKSWLQVLMDIGGKYGFYLILKRFIRF